MKNHRIWMIIGCVLPLLFIFFLPLIGAGSGEILFIFFIICFGALLLMMGGHNTHKKDNDEIQKGGGRHGNH